MTASIFRTPGRGPASSLRYAANGRRQARRMRHTQSQKLSEYHRRGCDFLTAPEVYPLHHSRLISRWWRAYSARRRHRTRTEAASAHALCPCAEALLLPRPPDASRRRRSVPLSTRVSAQREGAPEPLAAPADVGAAVRAQPGPLRAPLRRSPGLVRGGGAAPRSGRGAGGRQRSRRRRGASLEHSGGGGPPPTESGRAERRRRRGRRSAGSGLAQPPLTAESGREGKPVRPSRPPHPAQASLTPSECFPRPGPPQTTEYTCYQPRKAESILRLSPEGRTSAGIELKATGVLQVH